MYDTREEGLGIALPAIGGAISTVGGIFKGSKDPERLAANLKAYNAAMAGALTFTSGNTTMNPVEFLRQKSIPGGWATEKARADAEVKYKAVLAAKKPASAYPPTTAKPVLPEFPVLTGGPVVAGMSTGPLLIAGLAAAALFALTSDKKRR